jgi:uncharacterized membrane protein YkvA (DUF1232 family)
MNKLFVINLINTLIANPRSRIITVILAIVYVISPFDIIPEFIPFVGMIDDGILVGLILNGFRQLSRLRKQEAKDQKKQPPKDEDIIDV